MLDTYPGYLERWIISFNTPRLHLSPLNAGFRIRPSDWIYTGGCGVAELLRIDLPGDLVGEYGRRSLDFMS
jgi:hypothetical protein